VFTSNHATEFESPWVIWNGEYGVVAMASVGVVEATPDGLRAWMAPPFDMLGPINLEALQASGRIAFAACIVMSRQRWQDDQAQLRRAAIDKRRLAQERLQAEQARFNRGRRSPPGHSTLVDERHHREALNLPADGPLIPSQIKTAYRRMAQKAHPDLGGSHEQFVRITEARNALLEQAH
jgi:hypothetical protein